jgi:hypothetical protein
MATPEGEAPPAARTVMLEWAVAHAAKAEREHASAREHFAQALFIALDLDAEAVVGFDDTHLVDYLLSHRIHVSFRNLSIDAGSVQQHFEEIVSMLRRGMRDGDQSGE